MVEKGEQPGYPLCSQRPLSGDSDSRAWVETLLDSGGVLTFLKATLQKTASRGAEDYESKISEKINLKYVEDFLSLEKVDEAVKALDISKIDERGMVAVNSWKEALEMKKAGKSDDGAFSIEDDD